jgi:hypothetical protein
MTHKYNIPAKPTYYNNIQFRSRLEARWAVFFDLIKWKYTYEPIDLNKWSPDFTIQTTAGKRFLVEVKPELYSDIELRLKIGTATDFAKGILIVTEMPFEQEYPNCIGLTSLEGKISNGNNEDDFEFCTSIIMNAYGSGNDIFNLCEANEMIFDNFMNADDFSTKLWNEAGNTVQFLKPKV